MSAAPLLSRLRSVRKNGPGKWVACCPAHEDKLPSLSIGETKDGRTLLHCFAMCDTADVLAAVGMSMSDLFPEKLADLPRVRGGFSAHDALVCLKSESAVIALVAADIAEGKPVSREDADRCFVAAGRIAQALETVHA